MKFEEVKIVGANILFRMLRSTNDDIHYNELYNGVPGGECKCASSWQNGSVAATLRESSY